MRGWGWLYPRVGDWSYLGNSSDLGVLLRDGLVLLGDDVVLLEDGILHFSQPLI